ncbi:hypothetical protein GCM10023231_28950 [Olivibacter ginsenosidimutans]|uniref:DUF3592 domain-containing protein n=1 Tax=Olivibacter ginsenosidimutans TaxID=1176537 RepID=A0ABP9BPX7_9SPHI
MPIYITVRRIFISSLFILGLAVFSLFNNSKKKEDYLKSKGTIEYLDRTFQDLPIRNKGEFRYLKIETYPYLFEIYEPNHEPNNLTIDDLKIQDSIDIYYYETNDTKNSGINRYVQFIDKDGKAYFIRNGFQKQLGLIVIFLGIFINVIALVLWKKGKLNW